MTHDIFHLNLALLSGFQILYGCDASLDFRFTKHDDKFRTFPVGHLKLSFHPFSLIIPVCLDACCPEIVEQFHRNWFSTLVRDCNKDIQTTCNIRFPGLFSKYEERPFDSTSKTDAWCFRTAHLGNKTVIPSTT